MKYVIPEVGETEIETVVLDLNGTLSVRGKAVDGVQDRISQLRDLGMKIVLFTGDRRGTADSLCTTLGISFTKAVSNVEKERFFLELDTEKTAAIGNARIDIGTFKHTKLSIATLQAEGIHVGILEHVDMIVPSINDALELFLDPSSLEATMQR